MSFRRDRLTWLAYALLAWFAYLQAAPGLVVPYLREELDIGYTTGGLHVALGRDVRRLHRRERRRASGGQSQSRDQQRARRIHAHLRYHVEQVADVMELTNRRRATITTRA